MYITAAFICSPQEDMDNFFFFGDVQ